jgi:hypothetical protein
MATPVIVTCFCARLALGRFTSLFVTGSKNRLLNIVMQLRKVSLKLASSRSDETMTRQ